VHPPRLAFARLHVVGQVRIRRNVRKQAGGPSLQGAISRNNRLPANQCPVPGGAFDGSGKCFSSARIDRAPAISHVHIHRHIAGPRISIEQHPFGHHQHAMLGRSLKAQPLPLDLPPARSANFSDPVIIKPNPSPPTASKPGAHRPAPRAGFARKGFNLEQALGPLVQLLLDQAPVQPDPRIRTGRDSSVPARFPAS